ncbi:MAG: Maf family protein [Planctomycetaceae bacterium]|jgi:septum formation protein|nr:Maf family protein [Planctomycetaceae bacterium]
MVSFFCNENNENEESKIYLASQSPHRAKLLKEAGIDFTLLPPDDVEQRWNKKEEPNQYACRMACLKALNVADKINCGMIIGCDTVTYCCDELLGKPKDKNDARKMLKFLRGRRQQVISGLCVIKKKLDNPCLMTNFVSVQTYLVMRHIKDKTLEEYLDTGAWIGKAGSFEYQNYNSWIKILEGSESNVIGLPLENLFELLEKMKYL